MANTKYNASIEKASESRAIPARTVKEKQMTRNGVRAMKSITKTVAVSDGWAGTLASSCTSVSHPSSPAEDGMRGEVQTSERGVCVAIDRA
jgi:hypothetical protein